MDLFVSTNPALTNLDPTVMATADRSVTRTGTEKVLYTNSVQGQVYYVAVRSQDQEGAEYAFFGTATPLPFNQQDNNGNIPLTVLAGFPVAIPDGSPSLPGFVTILALTTQPDAVRKVVVTNAVTHQNFGDTIGTLTHGQKQAVLNNHTPFEQRARGPRPWCMTTAGRGTSPGRGTATGREVCGTLWGTRRPTGCGF